MATLHILAYTRWLYPSFPYFVQRIYVNNPLACVLASQTLWPHIDNLHIIRPESIIFPGEEFFTSTLSHQRLRYPIVTSRDGPVEPWAKGLCSLVDSFASLLGSPFPYRTLLANLCYWTILFISTASSRPSPKTLQTLNSRSYCPTVLRVLLSTKGMSSFCGITLSCPASYPPFCVLQVPLSLLSSQSYGM